ncbi:type IV pilus secretin PilQ [Salinispirillum sp. LH 10-3-1]|uniref:Type IV pilus secretin PilQ n=1 Tax=Salinispirillum sp. LH 10-3-1 TaxID=2952525 RepID=A0AB38YFN7_9GAMM
MMKRVQLPTLSQRLVFLAGLLLMPFATAVDLTDIDFVSLAGGRTEVTLTFNGPAPEASSYEIRQPARISIDMPGVVSTLPQRYYTVTSGNTRAATVLTAGDRTRLVLNLTSLVPHDIEVVNNQLVITVGRSSLSQTGAIAPRAGSVTDLDFRRNPDGEAQIRIQMSDNRADVDIRSVGDRIIVDIPDYELPLALARRIDVLDFATSVSYITARRMGNGARIEIEPNGLFEYAAFQTSNTLSINVKEVKPAVTTAPGVGDTPFSGERISFNFQDIEIRRILQLIADTAGLSLVATDTVTGNITIRLENVPWDQALDLILRSRSLDKRIQGNILLVAPAQEIADQEQQRLTNERALEDLAPLQTEFVQINYATATNVLAFITNDENLLSSRGAASIDTRTNSLLIKETAANLERIRQAIDFIDVPVRQVMLESRIVVARSSLSNEMGIRWGGGALARGGRNFGYMTGGIEGTQGLQNAGAQWADFYSGGPLPAYQDVSVPLNTGFNPVVNMPASSPNATSFTVGFAALDYVLDLELSALESRGRANIVSQPKLITADGERARVASGTEIPYLTEDGIQFRQAVLSMEATPQITPDGRIMLQLLVTQDSPGNLTPGGVSINTNTLETQVLVDNGETLVLGGVYRVEEVEEELKTPILGDLPLIGRFFRSTQKLELKNELLIFITPKLIDERVTIGSR